MELELTRIDYDADVYDVRKAVAVALHGPDLYDPNDKDNKGRLPNFEIVMGKSPAGRIHNGKAVLRVGSKLGHRFFKWYLESEENRVVVKKRPLKVFKLYNTVPLDVRQTLEKALYIDPEQDRLRSQIENQAQQVRLRIAKVQFGIWYKPSEDHGQRRRFSVEHEREFLSNSAAYMELVYEHKLIRIDIGQRETEDFNYMILVKFSSIRKLGIGYDECRQSFVIFDLRTPPHFEQESYNGRAPEGIKRKGKFKTRDRISAIDPAHARVAPYAHHLRILLSDPDDLLKFEKICHVAQCEPRPTRVPCVDAREMGFFSHRDLVQVHRWIKTMDWKNAFQIEACLRSGLLTTHDVLVTLQKPIERAIHHYGAEAPEFLRLFVVELKMRKPDEELGDLFARMRANHVNIKPLKLAPGHISCHHVIITPSRILLEGPYTTQSNRVIRLYQSHDPSLVDHFIRVEFRDEDRLAYRWDGDVDGTWFLQQRVGGTLRHGFELGGRAFEYLAYSTSALRDHSVWFVSPFRDPVEGYVTSEKIRSSLGDFSKLLRMPSKYAARIAQAFTATNPSVEIQRDQWEEQDDLGDHTDGVGTISPDLRDMIWKELCRGGRHDRVKPSAFQFRFLGYKGVAVVDHRLKGIKMRLRESQRKFPVHDVEKAEFEVARSFDYPNPVHLNRPAVMALEDRGVDKETFIALQDKAKAEIYQSSDSLEEFSKQLFKHNQGGKFHLGFIFEQLSKLGLAFKDGKDKKAVESAFFGRLLRFSMNHSLREVKFKARIPVPESYQLVGVADEGQAYINEGVNRDDVFTLEPGRIYACIQKTVNDPPVYLKGTCVISRSPVIHPGDVQRVFAVGEPPADKICFFRGLKNVVVLPAVGERSLASCLAGGDLDGDTYDVYYANPGLIPQVQTAPADADSNDPWTLDDEHGDATVEDICNFIVEYINSDVMGLLSDRHIIIADQSKDGVFDDRCMKLARLCSQAVDYAKNGNPVDISGNNLPKPLIKFKPDWHKAEVTGARELDYYVSEKALGYMFRNVDLLDPEKPVEGLPAVCPEVSPPLKDPISRALAPLIKRTLNSNSGAGTDADKAGPDAEPGENGHAEQLHAHYTREMRYICVTHTLVDQPDVRLKEEEVVLGTILANCVQSRWRNDRTYRMRLHTEGLVSDIRGQIVQSHETPTPEQLRSGLSRAWEVWAWAQHNRDKEFIQSFSLIVLGLMFDHLKRLDGLPQ